MILEYLKKSQMVKINKWIKCSWKNYQQGSVYITAFSKSFSYFCKLISENWDKTKEMALKHQLQSYRALSLKICIFCTSFSRSTSSFACFFCIPRIFSQDQWLSQHWTQWILALDSPANLIQVNCSNYNTLYLKQRNSLIEIFLNKVNWVE